MSEEVRETIRRLSAEPNLADARRLVLLLERSGAEESRHSTLGELAAILEARGGTPARAYLVRLCNAIHRFRPLRYGGDDGAAVVVSGDQLAVSRSDARSLSASWAATNLSVEAMQRLPNCGVKTISYLRELLALAGLELVGRWQRIELEPADARVEDPPARHSFVVDPDGDTLRGCARCGRSFADLRHNDQDGPDVSDAATRVVFQFLHGISPVPPGGAFDLALEVLDVDRRFVDFSWGDRTTTLRRLRDNLVEFRRLRGLGGDTLDRVIDAIRRNQ